MNAASHAVVGVGQRAPASSAKRGVAPIAARSDRLTASAFGLLARSRCAAKKCRPSTSMSTDSTSSAPGVGAITGAVVADAHADRGIARRAAEMTLDERELVHARD